TLLPGDRLRIADYVFTVRSAFSAEPFERIVECEATVWSVVAERFLVLRDRRVSWPAWFGYRRWLQYPRWSAAGDIYSLGVVALYALVACEHTVLTGKQRELETLAEYLTTATTFATVNDLLDRSAVVGPRPRQLCADIARFVSANPTMYRIYIRTGLED